MKTSLPDRGSLASQTLIKMGVRVAAVIIALTTVSYYHVMSTITHQALDDLQNYIKARGDREQAIFDLAYDNHQAIKTELIKRIHDYDGKDPAEEFDRRYTAYPDGAVGTRPELFDPARTAGVGIHSPAILDAALRRRVLAAQDTIEQMGRALHPRFQNTYFTMPENVTFGYWPEEPRGPFTLSVEIDFCASRVFKIADPQRDPERQSVWSGMYRDRTKQVGMVSLATPVYEQDRFVGVIGHDVTLTELLERTVSVRLEGTYNIIVEGGGDLIAHPMLTSAIERANGKFNVAEAGDPDLQSIHEVALTLKGDVGVLEDTRSKSYLGVVRIRGPGWYLITVYPKALLKRTAYSTARGVLFGGIISLLLELVILYLVLREQVAAPLALFLGATKKVASGDMNVELGAGRNDELGELATSFNQMAHAVLDREAHSKRVEETLRRSQEELAENLEREIEKNELLERLRATVDVLSTPVLPIWESVLVLPVVGAVDDRRGAVMMEKLLAEVARLRSRFVIIDVTGVEVIDAATADRLLKLVRTVQMLGARCILTGVAPLMAQTLVELQIRLDALVTLGTVGSGLRECIQRMQAAKARRSPILTDRR